MASEQWAKGETCRDLIEDKEWLKSLETPTPEPADDDEAETVTRDYVVEVSGKRFEVKVHGEAMASNGAAPQAQPAQEARAQVGRRRRRRRRHARLPDAGQHFQGARRAGRRRSRKAR